MNWDDFLNSIKQALASIFGGDKQPEEAVNDTSASGQNTNAPDVVHVQQPEQIQVPLPDNGPMISYLDVPLDNSPSSGLIRDMWYKLQGQWKDNGQFPDAYNNGLNDGGFVTAVPASFTPLDHEQANGMRVAVASLTHEGATITVGQLREALLNAKRIDDAGNLVLDASGQPIPVADEVMIDKMIQAHISAWNYGNNNLPHSVDPHSGTPITLKTQLEYAGSINYDYAAGIVAPQLEQTFAVPVLETGVDPTTTYTSIQDIRDKLNAIPYIPTDHSFVDTARDTWAGLLTQEYHINFQSRFNPDITSNPLSVYPQFVAGEEQLSSSYAGMHSYVEEYFKTNLGQVDSLSDAWDYFVSEVDLDNIIKRGLAEKALTTLDMGLYPDRRPPLGALLTSDQDRVDKILEGIKYAQQTGDDYFVDTCINFLEKNGCTLKFVNGELQVDTLPRLKSETASLGQDQTVSYIPGMDEANFNNITNGVFGSSAGKQQQAGVTVG